MESLTQSERNVLYASRDYARFRKQFYVDVVAGNGSYLTLLLRLQAIRNLQENLVRLDQSLRTHEALAEAGVVSQIQVEQVFQRYQGRKLRLIRAQNDFQNDLDDYKIRLGLPPEFEVELDDSLLNQFELNSPELTQLQADTEDLLASFRILDAAPESEILTDGFRDLLKLHKDLLSQFESIDKERDQWQTADEEAAESEQEYEEREDEFRDELADRLAELRRDMAETGKRISGCDRRAIAAQRGLGTDPTISASRLGAGCGLVRDSVADPSLLDSARSACF